MKKTISSYQDLKVWKKAIDLTEVIYKQTQSFPDEEKFGLVSQMQRAAVSAASNIAEGWGRGKTREYTNFLRYARASLVELETQISISCRLGFLTPDRRDSMLKATNVEGKMLLSLIRSLKRQAQKR